MPFNMNFSKESLSGGGGPLPEGWYQLMFRSFKPEATKNKDSVNLNAQFEIVNNPEYDGRRIFETLSLKFPPAIQDFVHACGLQMEPVPGSEEATIPGAFKGMDTDPDEPSKWEYLGPLTNKIFEAEIADREYQGKKSSKIKQYKCAVTGCNERHITNLLRKSEG